MKFESHRCETKLIEGGKYFFDVGAEIGELVKRGSYSREKFIAEIWWIIHTND